MKGLELRDSEFALYFSAGRFGTCSVECDDTGIEVWLDRKMVCDLYNWLGDIIAEDLAEDERLLDS
jgi:hypothetical protein